MLSSQKNGDIRKSDANKDITVADDGFNTNESLLTFSCVNKIPFQMKTAHQPHEEAWLNMETLHRPKGDKSRKSSTHLHNQVTSVQDN